MIRVESITIIEFRGIRNLTLDFKGTSFGICGPNGTGKSGVVDALEFALTGNVSRLTGEGRGEVSLKQHGPHVDKRGDPDKARVTAKITITNSNKSIIIERSLKSPTHPIVTPNDPDVIAVLEKVKAHPEIVLSRRELIRYVLATPGKRSEEVQALLHLDQVEQVRVGLQKIANNCERQLSPLATTVNLAKEKLLIALEITDLTKEKVLAAANAKRIVLGLPQLIGFTESTTLKDGMATQPPSKPHRIPKKQAQADIEVFRETLADITSETTTANIAQLTTDLSELANDPAIAASVKRESFYSTGIELIEAEMCPLCDTPWDLQELKRHIQTKVEHLNALSIKRKAAELKLAPLIAVIQKLKNLINTLISYSVLTKPKVASEASTQFSSNCNSAIEKMTAFLPLSDTLEIITNIQNVPDNVLKEIDELKDVISAIPEPTIQNAARDWLSVGQERLEVWRDVTRKHEIAIEHAQKARLVSDTYASTSDSVLEGIYRAVENDFASLYSFINRDDEDDFKAQLIPSIGKLGFDVDFYGRGFFPPGAYHSEGHQDCMGLCLYLALMKYIQGDDFTFGVLDDVLMSVDASHRREVCTLLKKQFPNTQFIMTTHDPIWLRHMKTEGLTKGRSSVYFRNWSIDSGPNRWDERDIWTEVDEHLNNNDVRGAAALLRNYLEYISTELCHRLRAPVAFRGDAQYQLGELLPAAIKQMRWLYARSKKSANSWNLKELIPQLTDRETKFAQLAETSNTEQWQINSAVHYNSWENLSKEDFKPVVDAFRNLLSGFACSEPECSEYFYVSPDRETPKCFRCDCGKTNINIVEKK